MLTRETMGGLYALPPTPFTEGGEFDEDSFRHNCRVLIDAGVDAITTPGSIGEFHTMTWDMLKGLITALVDECRGKVTAIAGCSAVNTEEAIMRTRFAMEAGADAVMNVSPYYVQLTQKELVAFWQDLSAACPDIGLVVYNNPQTAQKHDAAVFSELSRLPNMCGSKEGHWDWDLLMELFRVSDLKPMTATDLTWFIPAMKMGSPGIFSLATGCYPHHLVKMYRLCEEERWDEAIQMQWRVKESLDAMWSKPYMAGYNGIAIYKAAVNACGQLRCGKSRKPLISVSDEHQAMLTEDCRRESADLLDA